MHFGFSSARAFVAASKELPGARRWGSFFSMKTLPFNLTVSKKALKDLGKLSDCPVVLHPTGGTHNEPTVVEITYIKDKDSGTEFLLLTNYYTDSTKQEPALQETIVDEADEHLGEDPLDLHFTNPTCGLLIDFYQQKLKWLEHQATHLRKAVEDNLTLQAETKSTMEKFQSTIR